MDRFTPPGWCVLALLVVLLLTGCSFSEGAGSDAAEAGAAGSARQPLSWPERPPVRVCGNGPILKGPSRPPAGAVVVPAGDNGSFDFERPGATFWFAPGTHSLGPGQYSQIRPARGSRFVGAPGAVLDGRRTNSYAFAGRAPDVTIEHLTIQNFGEAGGNNNAGVVNHDAAPGWTIRRNTVRFNAGAGLMIGSDNVVQLNCLTRNGQYGFNAYGQRSPVGITLERNEISHNNTDDWERVIEGCGCTGGGKFWSVTDARVVGNYVHHNRSVGLWADNNNRGFLFARNYISDNDDVGLFYETSYNALIRHNTFRRNGLVEGPRNAGFPVGGIYVSESGSDLRVETDYRFALRIRDNLLEDNWAGVVLWENADRFCGSPANTSTGECTLVNPDVITADSCNADNITRKPYLDDCRWKTQNVKVHDNTFRHSSATVGPECTFGNTCGVMSIMSNYGTYPDWSPYQGRSVQRAVTLGQDNEFYDNTYEGRWQFLPFEQGNLTRVRGWRGAPFHQDRGSTFAPRRW